MGNPQTNQRSRRITGWVTRALACLGLVAATTWVAFSLLRVNSLIAGFAYVLVVLVVAAKWSLAESFLTSVASMLCLNYFFLPPVLSLTIADPQNWVALFVFLVTAITASKLSSNARQRADEAQARRVEVERLYQFSRSLMLIDTIRDLGVLIAEQVKQHFGFSSVVFCDGLTGEFSMTGAPDEGLEQQVLRDIAVGGATWFVWRKESTAKGIEVIVAPVSLGGKIVGSIGAIGPAVSEPALQAIANMVGIAVERARQQDVAGRMEAARQNERLRGILLDALAHDFTTHQRSLGSLPFLAPRAAMRTSLHANRKCPASARSGGAFPDSVDSVLRAVVFKACGSTDPMRVSRSAGRIFAQMQ